MDPGEGHVRRLRASPIATDRPCHHTVKPTQAQRSAWALPCAGQYGGIAFPTFLDLLAYQTFLLEWHVAEQFSQTMALSFDEEDLKDQAKCSTMAYFVKPQVDSAYLPGAARVASLALFSCKARRAQVCYLDLGSEKMELWQVP